MKRLATIVSWVFLPLFTPLYALLVALYLPIPSASYVAEASLFLLPEPLKLLFILLFLVFIVLAPGFSFYIMKRSNTISSLMMDDRTERSNPIALMTFYCIILFGFLHYQAEGAYIPTIIKAMVLGGAVSGAVAFLINKRMKISLHSIGMGALFGFLYMFSLPLIKIPLILLSSVLLLGGIVMSARLLLNAHSLREVGYGYLLGFMAQLLCIFFY